jgi:hypothetical protein
LNESKIYTSEVVKICENGDAIIQFSDEMMDDLGWKVDDTLTISMVDGVITLKNTTQNSNLFKE